MDRDGVQAEVIYGIPRRRHAAQRRGSRNEMFRIYNDWLKNFCTTTPTDTSAWPACPTATSTPP
jgi:hypothetical protein